MLKWQDMWQMSKALSKLCDHKISCHWRLFKSRNKVDSKPENINKARSIHVEVAEGDSVVVGQCLQEI